MGRQRKLRFLAFTAVCVGSFALPLRAQTPEVEPPPASSPSATPADDNDQDIARFRRRPLNEEEFRQRLENMPPEQREQFRRNFDRWQKLTPKQREKLRQREEESIRKRVAEAKEALAKSGLQLSEDQQLHYLQRFMRERRQIEAQIRREMEAKRENMTAEMTARLKNEFSGESAAATP